MYHSSTFFCSSPVLHVSYCVFSSVWFISCYIQWGFVSLMVLYACGSMFLGFLTVLSLFTFYFLLNSHHKSLNFLDYTFWFSFLWVYLSLRLLLCKYGLSVALFFRPVLLESQGLMPRAVPLRFSCWTKFLNYCLIGKLFTEQATLWRTCFGSFPEF